MTLYGRCCVGSARFGIVPTGRIWGDNFEGHERWGIFRGLVEDYGKRVAAAGGHWQEWDLPAMGIPGNSHFPMMDRNSDRIAQMVQDWLKENIA